MSLKAMAAAWLPDRLVPRRERTAVSQEQERAAHRAAATARPPSHVLADLCSGAVLRVSGCDLVL